VVVDRYWRSENSIKMGRPPALRKPFYWYIGTVTQRLHSQQGNFGFSHQFKSQPLHHPPLRLLTSQPLHSPPARSNLNLSACPLNLNRFTLRLPAHTSSPLLSFIASSGHHTSPPSSPSYQHLGGEDSKADTAISCLPRLEAELCHSRLPCQLYHRPLTLGRSLMRQ
jgi:hypothetical protein